MTEGKTLDSSWSKKKKRIDADSLPSDWAFDAITL